MLWAVRAWSAHCSRMSCSLSPCATKSQSMPTSLQLSTLAMLTSLQFIQSLRSTSDSGNRLDLAQRSIHPLRFFDTTALEDRREIPTARCRQYLHGCMRVVDTASSHRTLDGRTALRKSLRTG